MKRYFWIACLLIGVFYIASPQEKTPVSKLSIGVSAGLGAAVPDDVNAAYDNLIASARLQGVPIEAQTHFGHLGLLNADVLYHRLKDLGIGVSFGYGFSPAYSRYKDAVGTMDITGSVACYLLALKAQATTARFGDFPLLLNFQFGVWRTKVNITEEARFSGAPVSGVAYRLDADEAGPFLRGTFGTSWGFGRFSVGLEGGCDFVWVDVEKVYLSFSPAASRQQGKTSAISSAGLIGLLSLRFAV